MNSRENLINLLEEYPLYKKVEIDHAFVDPERIKGIGFSCFCNSCKTETTHKLHFYTPGIPFPSAKFDNTPFPENGVDEFYKFSFTQSFYCFCQKCEEKTGSIILYCETDKEVQIPETRIFIQKIGQYPPFNFKANKKTLGVLSKCGQKLYKKANNLYVSTYGIGCMVYLRRIVEDEVLLILKKVIPSDKIKDLEQVEAEFLGVDKKKVYQYAGELIPQTIKQFGDNPIQKLWDISSIAIHSQTDEEAMEVCGDMIYLLDFLIDRLDFEQNESSRIKNILKK